VNCSHPAVLISCYATLPHRSSHRNCFATRAIGDVLSLSH